MAKDPGKSFAAAIKQMAQLLRTELKERNVRALPSSPLLPSFSNALGQIAKLLRSRIPVKKSPKKSIAKKVKKNP